MWLNKQDTVAVLRKDQLFLLKCLKTQCPPSSPCVSIDDRVLWAYLNRYAAALSCTVSGNTFTFPIFAWYYHIAFCHLSHGELKAWTLKIWRDFRPSFKVTQHIWWSTLNTTVWHLSFPSWVWQQRNNGRHVITQPNNPSHQIKKTTASSSGCDSGGVEATGFIWIVPPPLPVVHSIWNLYFIFIKACLPFLAILLSFLCFGLIWAKSLWTNCRVFRSPVLRVVETDLWLRSGRSLGHSHPSQSGCDDTLLSRLKSGREWHPGGLQTHSESVPGSLRTAAH